MSFSIFIRPVSLRDLWYHVECTALIPWAATVTSILAGRWHPLRENAMTFRLMTWNCLVYCWEILCWHYFWLRRFLTGFATFCWGLQDCISTTVDCWGGTKRLECHLNSWSMSVRLAASNNNRLNIEPVWWNFTWLAWWLNGFFTEDPFRTRGIFSIEVNHLPMGILGSLAQFLGLFYHRDSIGNWVWSLRRL